MNPTTRTEIYMAAAVGEYSGELPLPITREDYYLKKFIDSVNNGGSVLPEQIDTAIEAYLNSHSADIVTRTELTQALGGKAATSHDHDDRYYTEVEINNKLGEKSNTGHSHAIGDVTGLEYALLAKADAATIAFINDDEFTEVLYGN